MGIRICNIACHIKKNPIFYGTIPLSIWCCPIQGCSGAHTTVDPGFAFLLCLHSQEKVSIVCCESPSYMTPHSLEYDTLHFNLFFLCSWTQKEPYSHLKNCVWKEQNVVSKGEDL